MKILHTADWHLGKKLDNYSRLDEQKEVLQEICEIADREKVDAVIIAGDLYDTYTPPTEAVTLFYKTLKKLAKDGARPVIAIAGNHDSPDRIEAPEPLALECGIFLAGYPYTHIHPFKLETSEVELIRSEPGFLELKLPQYASPLRLLLTPYANELRLKTYLGMENREDELRQLLQQKWQELADKYCDNQGINMLIAHLFVIQEGQEAVEEDLDEEKSILHIGGAQAIYTRQFPAQMQYVALGHLHRKQTVDTQPCPIVYSSSPLAYSFAEANQDKYVIIVEAEAGKPADYQAIKLTKGKRLLRQRFESIEAAEEWLTFNQDALVEITMVTDHYLTAQERRHLNSLHAGIKAIIPEVKFKNGELTNTQTIDLNKDRLELFKDYFKSKNNGLEPNDRLLSLFKEISSK
ncbi:MAG: exonuclease SbcCD subunit D [Microscillaceae bacterium]|jgi:exonuclease SbcD|nr:exonuclease SbcCD subunit D [Microscillaceae bacterium]